MFDGSVLARLTDKNAEDLIGAAETSFIILFESRYDYRIAKMIEAFQSILRRFESGIAGFVCMVEDAPDLSKRFNVYRVPTTIAGKRGAVLGVSSGIETADQLKSLVEICFRETQAIPGQVNGEFRSRNRVERNPSSLSRTETGRHGVTEVSVPVDPPFHPIPY
ncbi:MAG: thioredoxin family protein [bacterium]